MVKLYHKHMCRHVLTHFSLSLLVLCMSRMHIDCRISLRMRLTRELLVIHRLNWPNAIRRLLYYAWIYMVFLVCPLLPSRRSLRTRPFVPSRDYYYRHRSLQANNHPCIIGNPYSPSLYVCLSLVLPVSVSKCRRPHILIRDVRFSLSSNGTIGRHLDPNRKCSRLV